MTTWQFVAKIDCLEYFHKADVQRAIYIFVCNVTPLVDNTAVFVYLYDDAEKQDAQKSYVPMYKQVNYSELHYLKNFPALR